MAADLGGREERIAVLTRDVSASAREPPFPLSVYGVMIRDGALAASCAISGETVTANTKIHGSAADERGNRRTFCVEFFNFSPTLSGPFIYEQRFPKRLLYRMYCSVSVPVGSNWSCDTIHAAAG
jgi:hypothetical protein